MERNTDFKRLPHFYVVEGFANADQIRQVFEDDGSLMSGITSVVYDSKRKKLFMHGG